MQASILLALSISFLKLSSRVLIDIATDIFLILL